MTDVFKGEVKCSFGWKWTSDGGIVDDDKLSYWKKWSDGYGDNQAEAVWFDESASLLEDASTTLDLTALTRTVFGNTLTITFTRVKGVMIVNEGTGLGKLAVGDAASNAWWLPFGSDGDDATIVEFVNADSMVARCHRQDGWDVDATHKNLKLQALNGIVTYSIAIVGTVSETGIGSSS